jgi:hypothetical protein
MSDKRQLCASLRHFVTVLLFDTAWTAFALCAFYWSR